MLFRSSDTEQQQQQPEEQQQVGLEDSIVPPVEDPEVIAMKEEITKMEQDIKSARRQLADINDQAEEYTKTGYARKVAEMENMRRARSVR